jgi:hypothetical protein
MHDVLQSICVELDALASALNSAIPSDAAMAIANGNWSFPAIDKGELIDATVAIAQSIRDAASSTLKGNVARLESYPARLQFVRTNTIPNIWGNAAVGIPTYLLTLSALRDALALTLVPENPADSVAATRKMTARLRALESRLHDLEPRSANLADMIARIESANEAADQLPTDLETLEEARSKLKLLLQSAEKENAHIASVREGADRIDAVLEASMIEAAAVLKKCESAYSAATSQGLAAAFTERSKDLTLSTWAWVVALAIALWLGVSFGSANLRSLAEVVKLPGIAAATIVLNMLLALLSVAAPVWFAWLATKQIGQRFRLAEDYAYKASISRAYEGYRKEAARIDKDLEARLLASALDRLDEQPLRLVESTSHGSPWHELLSSDSVKDAVKSIPGFAEFVTKAAKDALQAISQKKTDNEAIPVIARPAD